MVTKKYLSDFGYDPSTLMRALAPSEHRYTDGVPSEALRCALSQLDTRYPPHDMAEALNQIGAMIPAVGGGTFAGHPPGAIADALRRALAASRVEPPAPHKALDVVTEDKATWCDESCFYCSSHARGLALNRQAEPVAPHTVRLFRDQAEFIVDACEKDGARQWDSLNEEVRRVFGMGPLNRTGES
jgi:hypothetical protein